ncbi:conserved hypothetical protein [Paraburkholderia piptadeniae]|uniref:Uncharacterized protein n=1 Tax=Paraburkholderia piptadeniae TaxID=1701573 RepID=A0A1N7SLL8_9BURK|nr:conserved hypothetical protein [Paraburkholderia piptadeniae]
MTYESVDCAKIAVPMCLAASGFANYHRQILHHSNDCPTSQSAK